MAKTALVLAGGGSRGSYELGVWQALREMDIDIHMVTGTSIGAINGAAIAQGDYAAAVQFWDSLETQQVIDLPPQEHASLEARVFKTYQGLFLNFIKEGGTDVSALRKALESFLDEAKLRASPIDFGLVTLEMEGRRPRELFLDAIPKGELIDYLLASAAIYPALKPHTIGQQRFLDGAYHDNLPASMALARGAEEIIAVDLHAFGVVRKEVLQQAKKATYIHCHWDLGASLVFDQATMRRNTRLGYLDTLKAFGAYEGRAYAFLPGTRRVFAAQLAPHLPLEQLLLPKGGGPLDQLFLRKVVKLLGARGASRQKPATVALVCAELAGEIFGLDPCTIYSHTVFRKRMAQALAETPLPGSIDFSGRPLLDLGENLRSLLNRPSRAKMAGNLLAQLLEAPESKPEGPRAPVSPELFLAALYLVSAKLI